MTNGILWLGMTLLMHGFAHRDLMSLEGSLEKTPLFNQNYNDALTFAESDLKCNWKYYKMRFLGVKDE